MGGVVFIGGDVFVFVVSFGEGSVAFFHLRSFLHRFFFGVVI